jgi:SNF2 family DNA or RNA helicase
MLRRRKADVENELPSRHDRQLYVPLSESQRRHYAHHEQQAAGLISLSQRRSLLPREQDRLFRELAMMRMVCDTPYILTGDPEDRDDCPKLRELDAVLATALAEDGVKVIVFSEWIRMLELVRALLDRRRIGYGWHTGSVTQSQRRTELLRFKNDPSCRVFLCSESGGVGLNLQNASIVINCDLPWNPAKYEQRVARAWRKHQTRPVTVINLIAEGTLEHRMLATLAVKQGLGRRRARRPRRPEPDPAAPRQRRAAGARAPGAVPRARACGGSGRPCGLLRRSGPQCARRTAALV